MEHEKYEDLLQKHKEMQEEYETRLIHAHGDRTQNLAKVTQMYEAKLQAKTQQMNKVLKNEEESDRSLGPLASSRHL